MEVQRPEYVCPLCHVGFEGCIGGMQVGLHEVCGHFYHETCISKFLKGRCDGVTRCLICWLYFSESDFLFGSTDEEDLSSMKNSVCWICNEELRCRSPSNKNGVNWLLNKNYGSAQSIITLTTCDHSYHRECAEQYVRGFKEGLMLCGHCEMHIEGRLMRFRVFKDNVDSSGDKKQNRMGGSSAGGGRSADKSVLSNDQN